MRRVLFVYFHFIYLCRSIYYLSIYLFMFLVFIYLFTVFTHPPDFIKLSSLPIKYVLFILPVLFGIYLSVGLSAQKCHSNYSLPQI